MADIIVCPACGARNRVGSGMRGVPLCGKCKQKLPLPTKATSRSLTTDDFESAIGLNPKPVLVDFWASWCHPCTLMAGVLEKFAATQTGVTVAKVDIDGEPGLASQYQIFGVPTLVLFVKGHEVHRVSGVLSETQLAAEFRPWLQPAPGK